MATDLSATNSYPANGEITLSGTANTMHEIQLPAGYGELELVFSTNAGKVLSQGGTDGGVVTTEKGHPIPADTAWFYRVPRSKRAHSVWIWSGTASTVVSYWLTGE